MEAIKKRFEIDLDVKRSTTSRITNKVKQGDNGNIFVVNLTHDGEPIDLTGTRVLAVFSNKNGTAQQDTDGHGITFDEEQTNRITIELYTTSFAPGLVECEVQILSGENYETLITSAKFNFECERAIMNDETVQATDEYPLLVDAVKRVEEVEDKLLPIERNEDARIAAEEDRIAAETAREEAETEREQAEILREQEEADRIADEQIRIGNEESRVSAENARVLAEAARAEAEAARVEAEEARETAWGKATATTTTLDPGNNATAQATLTANGVIFSFGIPQGKQGDTGSGFMVLGYYETAEALVAAIASPVAGDAYGVGAAEPYDIYIWDGVNKAWVNNGPLQGPQGEPGYTPVKGTDYWTVDDKAEMVSDVLAALPTYGGEIDEL